MKKFDDLPQDLKQIAKLRLENPDLSLNDLSTNMQRSISKNMYFTDRQMVNNLNLRILPVSVSEHRTSIKNSFSYI